LPSSPDVPERPETAAPKETEDPWFVAARAAESKKGINLRVLDLRSATSFTDYFVICSGTNPRQIQAISDEVQLQLKRRGIFALGIEGYERAEWILADYGEFIVHIFSENAREFYDLERLWRPAKQLDIPS
jgi:ribosome-associated protein